MDKDWFQRSVFEKLQILKKRLKNNVLYEQLVDFVQQKQYEEVIRILLKYYYDPRYQYKQQEYKNEFITIEADDLDEAIAEIEASLLKAGFTQKANQLP